MAIITKSEITITKGFDTWQEMVYSIEDKLTEMGISFLFAGTEKDEVYLRQPLRAAKNIIALMALS